ncbi:hypothetical protein HK104_000184, partial [Borealophlyctis nickersoniae]
MSAEELASYQFQLEQVNEALEKDPGNSELEKLKTDLSELISLYANLVQPAPPKPSTKSLASSSAPRSKTPQTASPTANGAGASAVTKQYAEGQRVLAKWSGDGKFYDAVIEAAPKDGLGVYTVTFKGYGNKEAVKPEDIKPVPSSGQKRPISAIEAASGAGSGTESGG